MKLIGTPFRSALREVNDALGQESLPRLLRQPGMRTALRVTVVYHDFRASASVATLTEHRTQLPRLSIVYRHALSGKPLIYDIPGVRHQTLMRALHTYGFDRLMDQPNMAVSGDDWWLIERAEGNFHHGLVVAPARAEGVYAQIVEAVRTHLPESLREVR